MQSSTYWVSLLTACPFVNSQGNHFPYMEAKKQCICKWQHFCKTSWLISFACAIDLLFHFSEQFFKIYTSVFVNQSFHAKGQVLLLQVLLQYCSKYCSKYYQIFSDSDINHIYVFDSYMLILYKSCYIQEAWSVTCKRWNMICNVKKLFCRKQQND